MQIETLSTQDKVGALKKVFSEDIELFGKFFFPHHLRLDSPPFHREIYETIESGNPRIAIAAPRGHAKSTVVDLVYLCWAVVHKKAKFVLLISDTYSQAVLFLEAVKAEFENNDELKAFYGTMVSGKWSEGEILVNGILIKSIGAGMKVRGLKHRESRPDLVICDDLENDEMVESKERREKLENWFNAALAPSMDKDGRLIVIGTILHYDGLLNKLLSPEYKHFYQKIYRAVENNQALWPEHLNLQELENLKQEFLARGQGYLFYREYQNDPVSGENRKFKLEKFKYITKEMDEELKRKQLNTYITIDRGYSVAKTADATGIIVVSVDKENIWYVQMAERFKGNEQQLITKVFDLYSYWMPRKIGIEQKAFQYTLKPAMDDEMRKRNTFFTIEELRDLGRSKNVRIEGLSPRFETESVYLRREQTDLMDELIRFPSAPHDDLIDALAYMLELAESSGERFGPASKPLKPYYPELSL